MSEITKEALALRTKWNTLIRTGNDGPMQRQGFSDEEMEWLLGAAEKLAAVREILGPSLTFWIEQTKPGDNVKFEMLFDPDEANELRELLK